MVNINNDSMNVDVIFVDVSLINYLSISSQKVHASVTF